MMNGHQAKKNELDEPQFDYHFGILILKMTRKLPSMTSHKKIL